jgi:hypothetical protein
MTRACDTASTKNTQSRKNIVVGSLLYFFSMCIYKKQRNPLKMARKPYKKGMKKRRGVSKYGGRSKARVPRPIDLNQGTLFPIVRTSLLSTNANGVLDQTWAIGNVSIRAPASQQVSSVDATVLSTVPGAAWPAMLDSVRAVFMNMRVVSHSIQFLPVCAGGSSDQPASPIEFVYTRFGIDGGGNTSAAVKLTGYGSNQAIFNTTKPLRQ